MATWRSHPYTYKGYLFVLAPAVVFKARVDQASFTYPLGEVTFDSVTEGAYDDIQPGMTVLFGTTAEDDNHGRQRIRKAATSDTLYIGGSSKGKRDGEVQLTDNDYITVLDDYRVWGKIPVIDDDGVTFKDFDLTPTDGLNPPKPVANGGIGTADFIDDITGLITVDFDGTDAFAVAAGASISSHAWDFVDGTPSSANTATKDDVTFPEGFRWVHHTVTDSNGETHTRHIPVLAAPHTGANAPITNFEITSHRLTTVGQTISFKIFDDLDEGTYPDGTLVMYWEEEYYNGTLGSMDGPSGRKHMKFIGWHDTDEATIEAGEFGVLTETVLNCVDVGGRLARLPGFPQVVERDADPATWEQLADANIDRYVWYLLQWHSTALDLADFLWSGVSAANQSFTILGSDGGDLYSQADGRTQAIAHRLTCNKHGKLRMRADPLLQESGDRTATVSQDLDETDWFRIQYTHTRPSRYHWLWGSAIIAGTAEADADPLVIDTVFCTAPGKAPGQGVQSFEQGSQVIASQTKLNIREGHRYAARLNAFETYFDVALVHGGDAGIDPADMTWTRMTISATNAAERGLHFTDERFLPYEVEIVHDNPTGTKDQYLRIEREKEGTPAATYIPPSGDTVPPIEDPDEWFPPNWADTTGTDSLYLFRGVRNMAALGHDGSLAITNDFDTPTASGGPTWTTTALSLDGDPVQFCVDAFSPLYLTGSGAVNGWLITTEKIYLLEDLFGAQTLTAQKTFRAVTTLTTTPGNAGRSIGGSFGVQNHVVVATYYGADGVWVTYTTDGVNWAAEVQVSAHYNTGSDDFAPGVYVSSKTAGLVYISAFTSTGGTPTAAGFVSTDYGANWAETTGSNGPIIDPGVGLAGEIHCPYHDNASESLAYYGHVVDSGLTWYFEFDFRTEAPPDGSTYNGQNMLSPSSLAYYPGKGIVASISNSSGRNQVTIQFPIVNAGSIPDCHNTYIAIQWRTRAGDAYYAGGWYTWMGGDNPIHHIFIPFLDVDSDPSAGGVFFVSATADENISADEAFIVTFDGYVVAPWDADDREYSKVIEKIAFGGTGPEPLVGASTSGGQRGYKLYRTALGGSVDISPAGAASGYGPGIVSYHAIHSCPTSRQHMVFLGDVLDQVNDDLAVFTSRDAGDSMVAVPGVTGAYRGAIGGEDPDILYLWGDESILYSQDFGTIIEDKTGNLSISGYIFALAGG